MSQNVHHTSGNNKIGQCAPFALELLMEIFVSNHTEDPKKWQQKKYYIREGRMGND